MEPLSDPLIMNGSARAHNTRNRHSALLAGDEVDPRGIFKGTPSKQHNDDIKMLNNVDKIVEAHIINQSWMHSPATVFLLILRHVNHI